MILDAARVDWTWLASRYPRRRGGRCPNPSKMAFPTWYQAADHFLELLAEDRRLNLYECVCHMWHAGHEPRDAAAKGSSHPRQHLTARLARELSDDQQSALLALRDSLATEKTPISPRDA